MIFHWRQLTADEARLLLDHLDNVQASSLPEDQYRIFRRAKHKLLDIETDARMTERAA